MRIVIKGHGTSTVYDVNKNISPTKFKEVWNRVLNGCGEIIHVEEGNKNLILLPKKGYIIEVYQ